MDLAESLRFARGAPPYKPTSCKGGPPEPVSRALKALVCSLYVPERVPGCRAFHLRKAYLTGYLTGHLEGSLTCTLTIVAKISTKTPLKK